MTFRISIRSFNSLFHALVSGTSTSEESERKIEGDRFPLRSLTESLEQAKVLTIGLHETRSFTSFKCEIRSGYRL